jgi:hypothetical protein
MAEPSRPANPRVTRCGGRLTSSPPCTRETGAAIARSAPFQPVRDGPGQLLGPHRARLARAVFGLSAGEILLARWIVAQEQYGFRRRPT